MTGRNPREKTYPPPVALSIWRKGSRFLLRSFLKCTAALGQRDPYVIMVESDLSFLSVSREFESIQLVARHLDMIANEDTIAHH
jgi:hypothetical protein